MCVAYLRQKSRVNFRSTKVDTGKLKCKYLNRPWSTLAVNVLIFPLKILVVNKMGDQIKEDKRGRACGVNEGQQKYIRKETPWKSQAYMGGEY